MADGVWGAVARPAVLTNCNAVVFERSDGLLVVDSHSKPSAAAALVAQIRTEVSPKPVRYLVNSHFHWDHTQGNQVYRQAQIISSDVTRQVLKEGGAERLKSSLEASAKSLESYKQRLASAAGDAEKAYWNRMIADTQSYLTEMKSYEPVLPNQTFKDYLSFSDKTQDLEIVFCGRGHTAGDVTVISSSRKVAAGGDLLHGALPYIGDGYPAEWPATLVGLGMRDFDKFLGGHAGIQAKPRLYQLRDYLEELAVRVRPAKERGTPLPDIQKTLTPDKLKSFGGGYGDSILALVAANRKLGMAPPDRTDAEIVAGSVANNVAQVYATIDRK
jgi:glyoxylase-like metal-dependent hydrolase (beta-lactamase superfamily II)